MPSLTLRPMERPDWPAVAELIHGGTNAWYERHGLPPVFTASPEETQIFCRVYEALDPGCCVLAQEGDRIIGSCFYHPRPTHVSLGIMNVHPDAFGRGVARRLLRFVIDFAERASMTVRLVSSAQNLDSFSLYSRAGFVPYALVQDMLLAVPEDGFHERPEGWERVREGRSEDAQAMMELERELCGIERGKDFRHFLANEEGIWHVSVLEDGTGGLAGFLASVAHPASNMLGPGVMRDDDVAAALIARELDQHRGRSPVWLVPADRPGLVRRVSAWGARNCELHLAQALGEVRRPTGVAMPTFLPETG